MPSLCVLVLLWIGVNLGNGQKVLNISESLTVGNLVKHFNATWMSDTEFYFETMNSTLRGFNVETKTFRDVVTADILEKWTDSGYILFPDNKKILVEFGHQPIKQAMAVKCNIYDMEKNETYFVANNKTLRAVTLSPSGDKLAFVHGNNAYVRMPDGKEIQLTRSGKDGIVYNGVPDIVYQENIFPSGSALWFSPDGEKLAIGYFNDSDVTTFPLILFGKPDDMENLYPKVVEQRFPLPGTSNPQVKILIIDLKTPGKIAAELVAPRSVGEDHILGSVNWAGNESVLVKWLNRTQSFASFQLCDLTGQCLEVLKVEEPTGWVEARVEQCPSKDNCILLNWIDDQYQIWDLDLKTGQNKFEPVKDISVHKFYGYKKSTKEMFYQANIPGNTSLMHIYKNEECLSCPLKDENGIPCTIATAIFSKDFSYFVLKCDGPTVTYEKIYETKTGKSIYDWELNENAKEEISKMLLANIEIIEVPISGDVKATVKILTSPKLEPGKKYPLLMDMRGVPMNDFSLKYNLETGWFTYLAASKNIVVAIVEGRGIGSKGKKTLYSIKGKLGIDDIEDQFVILKYLQEKLPYIDSNRIGIWGIQHGAYVAGKVISKDPTNMFKCTLLHTPVSNWIYYDSIFTERIFGLPSNEENKKLYLETSLTHNVTNFKDHKILIIHGTAAEDIHYRNTLMLSAALSQADIPFNEMIYTDSGEDPVQYLMHSMHTMEDFWNKCFDLKNGTVAEI